MRAGGGGGRGAHRGLCCWGGCKRSMLPAAGLATTLQVTLPAAPCSGWSEQTTPLPLSHECRGAPVEAAGILALLATLVGIYSLPGVAIVCLVVPAQYYFGFRIIKNKVANQPNTNERFSVIQARGIGVGTGGWGARASAATGTAGSARPSCLGTSLLPPPPTAACPSPCPTLAGDPARHEAGQVLRLGALLRGAGEPRCTPARLIGRCNSRNRWLGGLGRWCRLVEGGPCTAQACWSAPC